MYRSKVLSFGVTMAALLVVFALSGVTAARAASNSNYERSYNLAVKAVSEKLQKDLGRNEASVKFDKVSQYVVTGSQTGIKGNGLCLLSADAEGMEINFDVKIDTDKLTVTEIDYSFANLDLSFGDTATAPMEEVVTEKLLGQISADMKTKSIVLALDSLETRGNNLSGAGEVRIGSLEWRKIEFVVALDAKGAITGVSYKIED